MPKRTTKKKGATRKARASAQTHDLGHLEIPEGAEVSVSPPAPGEVRCWVRLPMGYAGRDLDRGEEVFLRGLRNDEKLVRIGYVVEAKKGERGYECGPCSERGERRVFRSELDRDQHGRKRHRDRFAHLSGPEREVAEDQAEAREDRDIARDNPLYMDRTAAALG